jgi:hypothetical protein
MSYKILGTAVSNPANSTIGSATAVACTVASTQTITLEDGAGNAEGTISLPAGIHKVNKKSTQTLTFTGSATSIAHSD